MLNVTMGDGSGCAKVANSEWLVFNCENGDGLTFAKKILIHFDTDVKLRRVVQFINEGNNRDN